MSGLFGRPSNSMQQEVYTGMQVTTSLLGGSIPYVAGRTRVKMNLLWYGNWTSTASNSGGHKGGGSGGTKQYTYSAAFIAGLCVGPIQGTFNIWHDRMLLNGTSSANLTYENLALALGSSGQPVWGGFPAGTPTVQQIPYDHIAYVASSAYNFGSSASMPQLTFEVEGVVPGYSDVNSVFDADPSAVIPDYLLDSVHGALGNYPGTTLTIGSPDAPLTGATNSYQAYVMSMNLLTSPYEDTQRQSTDFLTEILDCTNSNVWLSCDTLKVIPYCDSAVSGTVAGTAFSYTPNLTPLYIFGDDDYCPHEGEPPVKLTRKPQSDSFNMLNVEYLDRSNYYNSASVPSSDLNDIAKYGPRLAPSKSWHQVTQATVARTAGQLWLQRQLYERNSYTIRVRRNYALAEGMDFIALNSTDPNLLLSGQLCQITEVETEDDDKGSHLVITAREIPGVTRTTAQYNWAGAQGYFANYAVDPGAVQTPSIFLMPAIPASISQGITVGIAVCGQTSNAAWLGCDVYCSVDGGTTYFFVGTAPEACRYGTLTASLAVGSDPDITNTLSAALANTNLQLSTAVTHAEADSAQTLMLVDSGSNAEVISYGTASLVSAGNYNLTYLRRQLYSSNNVLHSSGVRFVRLDGAIFQIGFDPGQAGQTVNFKFVSFNQYTRYGQQTLAGATAYSYTIPQTAGLQSSTNLAPRGTWISASATAGSYAAVNEQAIQKVGGTSVWTDCLAYTSIGFPTCNATGKPSSLTTHAMIGLSTTPTATINFNNNEFCWYNNAGTWNVEEGGSSVHSGPTALATDVVWVAWDGTNVKYFLNDPTTAAYTSLAPPAAGSLMYGYAPLNETGSGWNSARFNSGTVLAIYDVGQIGVNAATTVAETTSSNITINATVTTINSMSVGPFPVASTVVITVSGNVSGQNTSASVSVSPEFAYAINTAASLPAGHPFWDIYSIPPSTTVQQNLTYEKVFSLAANTTQTYYFVADSVSTFNNVLTSVSMTMKAEAIYR